MTTSYAPANTRGVTGPAIGTAAIAALALLWANYVDTPWKTRPSDWGIDTAAGLGGLLWTAGFVALGVGVVYGVVVRRALAEDPGRTGRTALVLAIVGAPLTVLAFWTGLPIVLGSAAVVLSLDARARLGRTSTQAAVALALGLLVTASALFFCLTG